MGVGSVKICPSCNVAKPLTEFSKSSRSKSGVQSWCKACSSANNKNWHKINRPRQKKEKVNNTSSDYQRKFKYGLSKKDYDSWMLEQDSACLICDIYFYSGGHSTIPVVDHDHTTGKVRGIICHSCNVGLGRFKDSLELLEHAVQYLKEFGAKE